MGLQARQTEHTCLAIAIAIAHALICEFKNISLNIEINLVEIGLGALGAGYFSNRADIRSGGLAPCVWVLIIDCQPCNASSFCNLRHWSEENDYHSEHRVLLPRASLGFSRNKTISDIYTRALSYVLFKMQKHHAALAFSSWRTEKGYKLQPSSWCTPFPLRFDT